MFTTDIVIVSYKDQDPIKKCLMSIYDTCKNHNVVIINNNRENIGFSAGVNKGIKKGSSPFVWLINSDAVILPGAQAGLISRMDADKRVGIVGSMQCDYTDPDIISHAGTQQAYPNGIHKGGRISMGHHTIPTKEKWVNFASVMLRREMIDKIGMLDENMFMFFSDSDYCYQARKNGWECWYEPSSKVLHRLNSSAKPNDWFAKDKEVFEKKWIGTEAWNKLDLIP